jgi:hypothetical protein
MTFIWSVKTVTYSNLNNVSTASTIPNLWSERPVIHLDFNNVSSDVSTNLW